MFFVLFFVVWILIVKENDKYLPQLIWSDQEIFIIFVLCWWFVICCKCRIFYCSNITKIKKYKFRMKKTKKYKYKPKWTDILVGTLTVSLPTAHKSYTYDFSIHLAKGIWRYSEHPGRCTKQQKFWNIQYNDESEWNLFRNFSYEKGFGCLHLNRNGGFVVIKGKNGIKEGFTSASNSLCRVYSFLWNNIFGRSIYWNLPGTFIFIQNGWNINC